jgi:uncharacterized protein (TIGR03435 family)
MPSVAAFIFLALAAAPSYGGPMAEAPPAPGEKAPPIAVETLLQSPAGAQADWEKLRGKVVVLEFWATWCGPCVAALPHTNELAERYKENVQFIQITNEGRADVEAFLAKQPMNGWVGLDTDRSVFDAYCVKGIPMTVLVRPDGVVDTVTYPTTLKPEHLDNVLAGRPSGIAPQGRVFILAGEDPTDDARDALCHLLIRPSRDSGFFMVRGGAGKGPLGPEMGLTALGQTVAQMLPWVYGEPKTRIVVTGVLPEGIYDIVAKLPRSAEDDFDAQLRRAVESTFGLQSRRETRELDVYVATLADGEHVGLVRAKGTRNPTFDGGNGSVDAVAASLAQVLSELEGSIARPVFDETGLQGSFDVHFRWDPAGGADAIVREAAKQLGLVLTPAKRRIEVTVVEARE